MGVIPVFVSLIAASVTGGLWWQDPTPWRFGVWLFSMGCFFGVMGLVIAMRR